MNAQARSGRAGKTAARASNGLAVRRANLQAALNLLRDGAPLSSPEIGGRLGVHPSTVARLMGTLEGAGLVTGQEGDGPPSVGRPPKVWQLNRSAGCVVGLALHPLFSQCILVDLAGRVLARRATTHDPALTTRTLIPAVKRLVAAVLEGTPHEAVIGFGVAVSGVVAPQSGILRFAGALFDGTGGPATDFPLGDRLARALPWPVRVANDANAGALAVFHHMVRRGTLGADGSLLYLMAVDTLWGFGSGVVVNGALYPGARGAAGEILHPGLNFLQPDWGDVPARALAGDPEAVREAVAGLDPMLEHFAALALTLDPDCVILGGALAPLGKVLRQRLVEIIRGMAGYGKHLEDFTTGAIMVDPLHPNTIAMGAAELVLDDLFRPPGLGQPGVLVDRALAGQPTAGVAT